MRPVNIHTGFELKLQNTLTETCFLTVYNSHIFLYTNSVTRGLYLRICRHRVETHLNDDDDDEEEEDGNSILSIHCSELA